MDLDVAWIVSSTLDASTAIEYHEEDIQTVESYDLPQARETSAQHIEQSTNAWTDFQSVDHWEENKLDRTQSSRMGWSDVALCLSGPVVQDLRTHFTQRYNFIWDNKFVVKKSLLRNQRLMITQVWQESESLRKTTGHQQWRTTRWYIPSSSAEGVRR